MQNFKPTENMNAIFFSYNVSLLSFLIFLLFYLTVWKQSLCDARTHGYSYRRSCSHSTRNVENRSNPHGKFVRSWSHYKCQVQGRNQSGLQVAKVLKDVSIYNYLQYYFIMTSVTLCSWDDQSSTDDYIFFSAMRSS